MYNEAGGHTELELSLSLDPGSSLKISLSQDPGSSLKISPESGF